MHPLLFIVIVVLGAIGGAWLFLWIYSRVVKNEAPGKKKKRSPGQLTEDSNASG
jgi:glycerol uptake facilitator-like aquaporin